MKRVTLFFTYTFITMAIFAQSANYQAQGKYYSAKENYQAKNYLSALKYLDECNSLMDGHSNELIEYLRILSYYNIGDFVEANKSMQRFFSFVEDREKQYSFKQGVERLSDTEIKDITKLIDKIDKGIELQKVNEAQNLKMHKFDELKLKLVILIDKAQCLSYSHEGSDFDGYILHLANHYRQNSKQTTDTEYTETIIDFRTIKEAWNNGKGVTIKSQGKLHCIWSCDNELANDILKIILDMISYSY